MTGIFINYRREDSAADAGRLFDDLGRRCRRDLVFMDLDIPSGVDFRGVLAEKLAACDVILALIGPRWLEAMSPDTGKRRLDDPGDFVRIEIQIALEKNKKVIPVLLPGAKVPRPEDLPEPIRDLAWRNAFELRRDRWAVDLNELIKQLPSKLGCGQELAPGLPARAWAFVLLLPILLLSSLHLVTVFRLQAADPLVPSVVASILLGAANTLQFRIPLSRKLLVGSVVALASVLLDSVLVPLLGGENVIPRADEVRLTLEAIASFAAARLAGYLAGGVLADLVLSRGGGRPAAGSAIPGSGH